MNRNRSLIPLTEVRAAPLLWLWPVHATSQDPGNHMAFGHLTATPLAGGALFQMGGVL